MSLSDHHIKMLENYIEKYQDSTDPKHIQLVSFANRRLEEELNELLADIKENDEGVPSKWNINDNRGVASHNWASSSGRTYTYVPPPPPFGKSMFRQVCKSFTWKPSRGYVWKHNSVAVSKTL